MTEALVIGKFYPPHNGHIHLIESALSLADHVTVVVYWNSKQAIDGEQRAEWLRETFHDRTIRVLTLRDEVYDDYNDPQVWRAHDALLDALLDRHNIRPTMVVSSENYGTQIAEYYDADNIVVDIDRTTVPISATRVRGGLFSHWDYLPLVVRRDLIPRIIVLGAESTGTTTLAKALTEHYSARYVPEYGREYTLNLIEKGKRTNPDYGPEDIQWIASDFRTIGLRQRWEESAAATSDDTETTPLVIGDTDSLATAVWESRYTGREWQATLFNGYALYLPPRDLYLLTDHVGVPFEQDGIRDGEHLREGMTAQFAHALTVRDQPWALVSGTHEQRMALAVNLIDRVLLARETI